MRPHANAALFGGALLTAGIAHAAPSIEYLNGSFATFEVDGSSGPPASLVSNAYPPYGWNSYAGDFVNNITVVWSSDARGMVFQHHRSPASPWNEYSLVGFVAFFVVSQDAPAIMQWASGTWRDSEARLVDLTENQTLVDGDDDPVGWERVVLTEGHTYVVIMSTFGEATGGGSMGRFELGSFQCNEADMDHNGVLNVEDVQLFVDQFLSGCGPA